MTMPPPGRFSNRVLACVFSAWLGISSVVSGQVTRSPDEVRKLAVGKYKLREYWCNHLHLKSANLTSSAGHKAGTYLPKSEVELFQRDERLFLRGKPFEGEVPLTIEGLRLSMSPLKVVAQPNADAGVKYTTLTLIQSLDASMLCGMSLFTNGGPAPGDKVKEAWDYNAASGGPPNCHGVAAFYLARSDGRREEFPPPLGTDGTVYRPKFRLNVSDPAGLAGGAAAGANTLLGTWLEANGFDFQENPRAPATFQFGVAVSTSFSPPVGTERSAKSSRFIALDGTNDVVVTNPLGIECGLTLTNAGLAGKSLLRSAYVIGLPGAAAPPSSCNLETEIRTLYVNQEKCNVYQPAPCYTYPSHLVMMLPARMAIERPMLKGFTTRLEELAYRRK